MLEKYIKMLNPVIKELNGKRIEKINGEKMSNHLYSFPSGILLSFELCEKEKRLIIKLGRKFVFNDCSPKLIIKSVENHYATYLESKLSKMDYIFYHNLEELDNVFDFLKNNLKIIIKNNLQTLENNKGKVLVLKEENKPYLLKGLSSSNNLELELKLRIKEVKEENKKENSLSELSLLLLVGLEIIIGALLLVYLFSLKDDTSEIPFAIYIIIALMILLSLVFLVNLTVAMYKKKRKQIKN